MQQPKLAADATIAEVIEKLRDPEGYVRNVLLVLYESKRTFGDKVTAEVRIGVTGQGKYPHYGIGSFWDDVLDSPSTLRAFNGTSHKPLTTGSGMGVNWSSRAMTIEEIERLLGEVRAALKARHRPLKLG